VGRTSHPGNLFFDPLESVPMPPGLQRSGPARGTDRNAVEEPLVQKEAAVDEKTRRAASLSKVRRDLQRMLRESSR
jgi:hypothetical protein